MEILNDYGRLALLSRACVRAGGSLTYINLNFAPLIECWAIEIAQHYYKKFTATMQCPLVGEHSKGTPLILRLQVESHQSERVWENLAHSRAAPDGGTPYCRRHSTHQ